MKKLVLMGPPGSGKGTQAAYIIKKYAIPHVSSGDILRHEVKISSDLGKKVKSYMDKGEIGPEKLITETVLSYLQKKCTQGFLLDGFPRTHFQAKELSKIYDIDLALLLFVSDDEVVKRITGRRICDSCGAIFHIETNPPENDTCFCGGRIYQRSDDTEETVRNRLDVYNTQTKPVIDFYTGKKLLHIIDGENEPHIIYETIKDIIIKNS